MSEIKAPTLADLKAQSKLLVEQGHAEFRGYSKANKAELLRRLAAFAGEETKVETKVAEEKEQKVEPTVQAQADAKPAPKKRAPSIWNTFCREKGISPGKTLTAEQKEMYLKYKSEAKASVTVA